jgi:ABC-type Fe3+ transport system permease subunit
MNIFAIFTGLVAIVSGLAVGYCVRRTPKETQHFDFLHHGDLSRKQTYAWSIIVLLLGIIFLVGGVLGQIP